MLPTGHFNPRCICERARDSSVRALCSRFLPNDASLGEFVGCVVVNYKASVPGTFLVDVSSFVAGKQGYLAYTWNIGTGVTTWVPFDCTASSTTTSTATEPASVASTTTVKATTTTLGPTGSTVTTDPGSTSTTVAAGTQELPFTGGNTGPLVAIAVAMVASGALLISRKSRTR